MSLHIKFFIGVYLLFGISLASAYALLPQRMASHFDVNGQPNGWSTPLDYVLLIGGISIVVPCLIYIPIALLPVSMMNIPNKAYWNTPERRGELKNRMKVSILEMLFIMLILLTVINFLVIYANETSPPNLPLVPMFILLGFFLVGIILQTTAMFKRLRPPEGK